MASRSSVAPRRITIGSKVNAAGLSRCNKARIGAMIICGAVALRNCDTKRIRSPIVSMPGLTRSNGKVSHAGKYATAASL